MVAKRGEKMAMKIGGMNDKRTSHRNNINCPRAHSDVEGVSTTVGILLLCLLKT